MVVNEYRASKVKLTCKIIFGTKIVDLHLQKAFKFDNVLHTYLLYTVLVLYFSVKFVCVLCHRIHISAERLHSPTITCQDGHKHLTSYRRSNFGMWKSRLIN